MSQAASPVVEDRQAVVDKALKLGFPKDQVSRLPVHAIQGMINLKRRSNNDNATDDDGTDDGDQSTVDSASGRDAPNHVTAHESTTNGNLREASATKGSLRGHRASHNYTPSHGRSQVQSGQGSKPVFSRTIVNDANDDTETVIDLSFKDSNNPSDEKYKRFQEVIAHRNEFSAKLKKIHALMRADHDKFEPDDMFVMNKEIEHLNLLVTTSSDEMNEILQWFIECKEQRNAFNKKIMAASPNTCGLVYDHFMKKM